MRYRPPEPPRSPRQSRGSLVGINLDPFKDEKKSDFQFSVGTTF